MTRRGDPSTASNTPALEGVVDKELLESPVYRNAVRSLTLLWSGASTCVLHLNTPHEEPSAFRHPPSPQNLLPPPPAPRVDIMSYLPDYEPVLVGAHIGLRSWFDEIHPDATGELKIHLKRNVRTLELLQEVFVLCFDLHVREKELDFATMKWEEWKIEELLSIMMPVLERGSLGPYEATFASALNTVFEEFHGRDGRNLLENHQFALALMVLVPNMMKLMEWHDYLRDAQLFTEIAYHACEWKKKTAEKEDRPKKRRRFCVETHRYCSEMLFISQPAEKMDFSVIAEYLGAPVCDENEKFPGLGVVFRALCKRHSTLGKEQED
eukprot:scaffold896_cov250-Pinguiococcus_pyrenoidosus.AAC.6